MGQTRFGKIPATTVKYLSLKDAYSYSGCCLRRMRRILLTEEGASMTPLKKLKEFQPRGNSF